MKNKKQVYKLIFIIAFDALIIFSLIMYFGFFRSHSDIKINGIYINNPTEIKELHFINDHGLPFENKDLIGHWSMLFFGFTSCEMICPATMAKLNATYKILQQALPANQLPQVVFISVDPKRDTIENLHKFVKRFNPNFMGIKSDIDTTLALAKQLHIMLSKSNPLSHGMDIVLVNPMAQIQAYFPYPHNAAQIAKDYKLIRGLSTRR